MQSAESETLPASPAALRLVSTIGDFVEPLTRFDHQTLQLRSSEEFGVTCTATETISARLSQTASAGEGPLPGSATPTASTSAMEARSGADLDAAHHATVQNLASWVAAHAQKPTVRPLSSDIFNAPPPAGFQYTCADCAGRGDVNCTTCGARGQTGCTRCTGDGKNMCGTCNMSGRMNCSSCGGSGGSNVQVAESVWNSATNQSETRYRSEWKTCWGCNGSRQVACSNCGGGGLVTCGVCHGAGSLTCSTCSGQRTVTCSNCGGHGTRHKLIRISCAVSADLDIAAATADDEIAPLLSSRQNVSDLLGLAGDWKAQSQQSGLNLVRTTEAVVPITRVTVCLDEAEITITGYGPNEAVFNYQNIVGLLLEKDLRSLEAALEPGNSTSALRDAYLPFIASEVHAGIASLKQGAPEIVAAHAETELKGAVTTDYAIRTRKASIPALQRLFAAEAMTHKLLVLPAAPVTGIAAYLATRYLPEHDPAIAAGLIFLGFVVTLGAMFFARHELSKTVTAVNPAHPFAPLSAAARLGLIAASAATAWAAVTSVGLYALLLTVVPPA